MGRYDGLIIFSDVDGTLMTDSYEIPPQNLSALRDFTGRGGRFALATGRGVATSYGLVGETGVNFPCVMSNGAIIYDYMRDAVIHKAYLPPAAWDILRSVVRERPDFRAFVWADTGRYVVSKQADPPPGAILADIDELPGPWIKLVFHVPAEERLAISEWVREMGQGQFDIVSSCDWFVEVLPAGVNKGGAVDSLIRRMDLSRGEVVVVGDFDNDREMLALPGVRSFCPANAPQYLQQLCKQVLCHVNDGAIADLIARL